MSLMLDLPPQMVQEVRSYAALEGTSLEKMCLDYIALELHRKRENKAIMDAFNALAEATSARRTAPYTFNRADAYEETLA